MGRKKDGFTRFYPLRTIIIGKCFTTHKNCNSVILSVILSQKKYIFIVANGSKGQNSDENEPHRTSSRNGRIKLFFPFLVTRAKYFCKYFFTNIVPPTSLYIPKIFMTLIWSAWWHVFPIWGGGATPLSPKSWGGGIKPRKQKRTIFLWFLKNDHILMKYISDYYLGRASIKKIRGSTPPPR